MLFLIFNSILCLLKYNVFLQYSNLYIVWFCALFGFCLVDEIWGFIAVSAILSNWFCVYWLDLFLVGFAVDFMHVSNSRVIIALVILLVLLWIVLRLAVHSCVLWALIYIVVILMVVEWQTFISVPFLPQNWQICCFLLGYCWFWLRLFFISAWLNAGDWSDPLCFT